MRFSASLIYCFLVLIDKKSRHLLYSSCQGHFIDHDLVKWKSVYFEKND
jgi:hypothetical protein